MRSGVVDVDADVVVVGAGPVGLLLAAELARAGVRPVVLERLGGPVGLPKARGIGVLAAEALRRRGLGDALDREHEIGRRDLAREHGTTRGHFAWIHKIDPEAADPGRRGALIAQPALERLLRDHLAALGGTVRYGWAVTGCKQDAAGVTVTADTPSGPDQLTAAYVVGCDGGHSAVRGLAGFPFPGTDPLMTVRYAKADVRDTEALPPPGRLPGGTLFHGDGVIATFDFTGGPADRDAPLSADEMRESVGRVAGAEIDITAFHGGLRFTDQARQASAYRRDRVLLAGDAAHVHSPNGGQGLNLGLMDAINLGWKLAATVRGVAPAGLLDSYHDERHPVGASVLHNTRAQSALLAPGPHVDALRDIFGDLMDLPEVNAYLSRLLSGVGHRYRMPYPAAHPMAGAHCPPLLPPDDGRSDDFGGERDDFGGEGGTDFGGGPGGDRGGSRLLRAEPGAEPIRTATGDAFAALLLRPDGVIAWAVAPGAEPDPQGLSAARAAWGIA
jgi:2-polyprenyl-6-methoxyphenol hydroxylase-like FAD-dependent oxidoreductase